MRQSAADIWGWAVGVDGYTENDFLFDYQEHIGGWENDSDQKLLDWCELAATDFLNENPEYQAGDNRIEIRNALWNHLQDYMEEEGERESSRLNL
jgi:hypothetical protein